MLPMIQPIISQENSSENHFHRLFLWNEEDQTAGGLLQLSEIIIQPFSGLNERSEFVRGIIIILKE